MNAIYKNMKNTFGNNQLYCFKVTDKNGKKVYRSWFQHMTLARREQLIAEKGYIITEIEGYNF